MSRREGPLPWCGRGERECTVRSIGSMSMRVTDTQHRSLSSSQAACWQRHSRAAACLPEVQRKLTQAKFRQAQGLEVTATSRNCINMHLCDGDCQRWNMVNEQWPWCQSTLTWSAALIEGRSPIYVFDVMSLDEEEVTCVLRYDAPRICRTLCQLASWQVLAAG